LKRQIDVYRRTLRVLSLVLALTCSHRAFAQEGAVTRLDLPIGRAYPYRADEVITRVTVANPGIGDAIVISEREIVINAIAAHHQEVEYACLEAPIVQIADVVACRVRVAPGGLLEVLRGERSHLRVSSGAARRPPAPRLLVSARSCRACAGSTSGANRGGREAMQRLPRRC